MARSPLFARVRTLLRAAAPASLQSAPRRHFLQSAFLGAGALALASCATTPDKKKAAPRPQPKIAIVGAGIAGLNCAWQLSKQNIQATVFEAGTRVGGRMFSKTGILGTGLYTELGGEFIDTGHTDLLNLCKDLKLDLLDMHDDTGMVENAWFFGGVQHKDSEIFEALKPLAARIASDAELTELDLAAARQSGAFKALDETSLRDYLDVIGASGWLRSLLEVAFITEYGLDPADQSCMNMLCLLATEPAQRFEPFGESDERFKVKGGNERVCTELARRLGDSVLLEHRLVRLAGGKPFGLTFDTPTGGREQQFDVVVLALPFTILRELEIKVTLPPEKSRAIAELGYGKNAKLLLGMDSRPWRVAGFAGGVLTDAPFQLAWDNSRLQWGSGVNPVLGPAGITLYSGGSLCDMLNLGTPAQQVDRLLPRLDAAFAGAQKAFNGKSMRMHWPTQPAVMASYAAYKPGQWTRIRGHEGEPVGDLLFAGEHCSLDSQGYMNGGAETGRIAAEQVLAKLPK